MTDENLTPAELLQTAEKLFSANDENMYRAAILEAITALEAKVRDQAFPALRNKVGDELTKWLEEKTRMDFETRIGFFIPVATGLQINKKDKIWNDYQESKKIRNKVTHSGKKVTQKQARFVINTVYEWIEYLNQAQENKNIINKNISPEMLGRFIQVSARLERVIYSTVQKNSHYEEQPKYKIYPIEELYQW